MGDSALRAQPGGVCPGAILRSAAAAAVLMLAPCALRAQRPGDGATAAAGAGEPAERAEPRRAPLRLAVIDLEIAPPADGIAWRASVGGPSDGGRVGRLVAAGPNGEPLAINLAWNEAQGCASILAGLLRSPHARVAAQPRYLPSDSWFTVGVAEGASTGFVCLPLERGALVAAVVAPALDSSGAPRVRPMLAAVGRAALAKWGAAR